MSACGEFETFLTLNKTKGWENMKKNTTQMVAFGGVIAALYVVLTIIASALGIASGAIQVRLSEALTILPVFTAAAVPGLTVGCVVANLVTGCAAWDVVFGSMATLLGAIGTRMLRDRPAIAWIPPVVSNMLIVPVVLMKVYGVDSVDVFGSVFNGDSLWIMLVVTVGIGEVIACGVLGMLLYQALKKNPRILEALD